MLDAIALGELLIDFATVDTDRDGYPTLAAHPGGAPGNFLAALHAYGCSGAMLGKVGADTFGDLLCTTLAQAGIRTEGIVRDPSVFTTLAFVTFGPGGERAFSFARKPGADTQLRFDELDLSLLDEARLLHFGSLSLTQEPVRSATQQAAAYAAHGICGAEDNRISQLVRDGKGVLNGIGHLAAGHFNSQGIHGLFELNAVFPALNGVNLNADHLDIVFIQNAEFREFGAKVEARLSPQVGKQGIGALFFNDLAEPLGVQGLNVGHVGGFRVGHNGRGIGIDQNNFVAELFQRLAGLSAGIVKFAGLSNDNWPGADYHYLMDVLSFHFCYLSHIIDCPLSGQAKKNKPREIPVRILLLLYILQRNGN